MKRFLKSKLPIEFVPGEATLQAVEQTSPPNARVYFPEIVVRLDDSARMFL